MFNEVKKKQLKICTLKRYFFIKLNAANSKPEYDIEVEFKHGFKLNSISNSLSCVLNYRITIIN